MNPFLQKMAAPEEEVYNVVPEEEDQSYPATLSQPMEEEETKEEATQEEAEYSRSISHDSDFSLSDVDKEEEEPAEIVMVLRVTYRSSYHVSAMNKSSAVVDFWTKHPIEEGMVVSLFRRGGLVYDWDSISVLNKPKTDEFLALVQATDAARTRARALHQEFKLARDSLAECKDKLEQALLRYL